MKFSILTIHPEIIDGIASAGLLSKAISKEAIELNIIDIRDFSDAPHFRVDDKPYGGGPGMVLKVEPIVRALRSVVKSEENTKIIVLSATGEEFTQAKAESFKSLDHIVLICGRYEGIDQRVAENFADLELKIGNYILMGGELAAGVIVEAVSRLLPEVLGNPTSLVAESFSNELETEYSQYTRPPEFEGHKVPDVLLGGNHKKISDWRSLKAQKKSIA